MIPEQNINITNLDLSVSPSKSYEIRWDIRSIKGEIDDYNAVYQAVQKILNTERSAYPIYTSNYGVELERLIGKDMSFVKSDITRILNEALLADDRVKSVENINILSEEFDSLILEFEVNTIHGRMIVTNI